MCLRKPPNTPLHPSAQVKARLLYIEPHTRLVGMSLRRHLVHLEAGIEPVAAGEERIGDVVKECKMTALHHMSGAMLELPDKTLAFVHVSHILIHAVLQ